MHYLCFTFPSEELCCKNCAVCFISFMHSFNRWLSTHYFLEGQLPHSASLVGKLIFGQAIPLQTVRRTGLRSCVAREWTATGVMTVEEWPEEMTVMQNLERQARAFLRRLSRRALWVERTASVEIGRWVLTAAVEGGRKPTPSSWWMNFPNTEHPHSGALANLEKQRRLNRTAPWTDSGKYKVKEKLDTKDDILYGSFLSEMVRTGKPHRLWVAASGCGMESGCSIGMPFS